MSRSYYIAIARLHSFLISKHLPICRGWEGPCFRIGKNRRHRTMYINEKDNWAVQCKSCYKAEDDHWAERFAEYYLGAL